MSRDNYEKMTKEPIPKLIGSLCVPTIISMLITSLYNMADTFFMGRINTQCTAAVGVSFSIMAVIQAVGFFFGHGSGNYMSRKLGAHDPDSARRMASTGFFFALIAGFLIFLFGELFLTDLSVWLGSTPTILPYTERFLGIIFIGAPFMTASLVLNNQMRFQGNALYAMVGIVSGALLNIILEPLFIFVLGLGITGAAIGTVISQIFSFFLLLYMDHKGNNISIHYKYFAPSLQAFSEIIRGGLPSLARQGLACVSTIFLNKAAGAYGDAAIAGMSIVTRLFLFINSFVVGFGQGFQPVCGFNYGAGLNKRVIYGFWFCVKTGFCFLLIMAIAGYCFAPEVVEAFRKGDPEVTAVGTAALKWQLITLPLSSWIILSNMMLQTLRKPVRATIMAASRQGLFFIPAILILSHYLGLNGVEMSQMVSDICATLIAIPLTGSVLRELKKGIVEKEAAL